MMVGFPAHNIVILAREGVGLTPFPELLEILQTLEVPILI